MRLSNSQTMPRRVACTPSKNVVLSRREQIAFPRGDKSRFVFISLWTGLALAISPPHLPPPALIRTPGGCRGKWTRVHQQTLLADDFRLDDLASLATKRKVNLFFIAAGPIDLKVVDVKTWRERLFKIVYAACDQLDPKGTSSPSFRSRSTTMPLQ